MGRLLKLRLPFELPALLALLGISFVATSTSYRASISDKCSLHDFIYGVCLTAMMAAVLAVLHARKYLHSWAITAFAIGVSAFVILGGIDTWSIGSFLLGGVFGIALGFAHRQIKYPITALVLSFACMLVLLFQFNCVVEMLIPGFLPGDFNSVELIIPPVAWVMAIIRGRNERKVQEVRKNERAVS